MSRARDRVGEDGSKLSARSGLPAYSGGDESSSCSRAASGRVCRRIAKLSLCPRCRWVVIPSEVDETERDEQCPVDRRQRQRAKFAESPDEARKVDAANLTGEHDRVEPAAALRPHGPTPRSDRVA